jgi:hypothetical protein
VVAREPIHRPFLAAPLFTLCVPRVRAKGDVSAGVYAGPNSREADRGRHAAIGQQRQATDRLLGRFHGICPGRLRNVAVVCAPSPQVGAFRLVFRFTLGCKRSAARGSTQGGGHDSYA